ncbi:MAB_1171c family putative transporter [Actinophytocola sp.]|uniref:MAB_1171c family putative transporter n=1 Tax=Actinophytocola sp. TaxID=1872138 RepID=UPI002D7F4B7F|nr:MAB_1171c family putative transporter [Actinophytocola sp.]HET9141839.1 MAB_1171c family putative transporter [Actinophytocola sp.]
MHHLLNAPAVWLALISVLWLAVVLRVPALRRSAGKRMGALLFLALTSGVTLTAATVRAALDSATGVPDLSILLGHLAMLAAMIFSVRIADLVSGGRHRALRHAQLAFGAAMVLLVALFLVIPRRADQPDFGLWHGRDAAVLTYQLIFQAGLGAGLLTNAVFLFRHWRRAPRGQVRAALLQLWLACVLGLGYAAGRVWQVLNIGLGVPTLLERYQHAAVLLLMMYAALLCGVAGVLLRSAGTVRGHLRRLVGYRRLRPLWARLTDAVPGTVLRPPPHPVLDLLSVTTLELRLYRRTVEIRDAQLELTGHVSARLRALARAELGDGDPGPALDACVLELALRIRQDGGRPEHPGTVSWSQDASLDGELNQLVELARLVRDPAVRAAADRVLSREPGLSRQHR